MNVALVIDSLSIGGAERVVTDLSIGLRRRGFGVCAYFLKHAEADVQPLIDAGVVIREARSGPHDWGLPMRLCAWLARDRVDVVNTHSGAALLAAAPAAWGRQTPLVHTHHGALLQPASLYGRAASFLAALVDRHIIVAESLRTRVRGGAGAVYIANGIAEHHCTRQDARAALERMIRGPLPSPLVLSIGTLCPEKDTLGLAEAMSLVHRAIPEAGLVCIGAARGQGYGDAVRSRIDALQLHDVITLAGPAPEARRLLPAADLFVLSSASEARPLCIIEAMAHGAPIVATTVGDVGTLDPVRAAEPHWLLSPRRTALLAPPGDPPALAAAMLEALTTASGAAERAAAARLEYERRHTVDKMVDSYAAVMRQVVRGGPAPRASTPRVMMLGPDPAAIGGMNSVIDGLMTGPLGRRAVLTRCAWPPWSPQHPRRGPLARGLARGLRVGAHIGAWLRFLHAMRRSRADVVSIHTCSGGAFWRASVDVFTAAATGRPVCLHIHGGRFVEFCRTAGPARRRLIAAVLARARVVFVLTREMEEQLARVRLEDRPGGESITRRARVAVLPNGVAVSATPRFRDRPFATPRRFVFVGELRAAKGVYELLDAAVVLRERGVPFEIVLAGPSGLDGQDWSGAIAARGLADVVRWIGPVAPQDRSALLAASDCLVLPSRVEALPMCVLEGAAAGLAVLATRVGGLPELFADPPPGADLLVPIGDPHALGAQMESLALDPLRCAHAAQWQHERVRATFELGRVSERLARWCVRLRDERRVPRRASAATTPEHFDFRTALARLAYGLHERLRGRDTLTRLASLGDDAARSPAGVHRDVDDRLRALVRFAAERVPFLADRLAAAGVNDRAASMREALARLPACTKADVRAAGDAACTPQLLHAAPRAFSGGTTGDTLVFRLDRIRQAEDRAARLFAQGWFGVGVGDARAWLWGSPIEHARSTTARARDAMLNELLLDAFDLSASAVERHVERLARFRPVVLYGYPSALSILAARLRRQPDAAVLRRLRLVVITGEAALPEHVEVIRAALRVPVANEYGNREVGLIAHECPLGRLHVMAPHVYVEILRGAEAAAGGEAGDIVVTTLNTRAQPFIRYRVGDVGRWASAPCGCGVPFPVLELLGGKVSGLLVLPDGRLCHGAVSSYAMKGVAGVAAFRTHQRAADRIEVLVQPETGWSDAGAELIRDRYRKLLGVGVRVDIRTVSIIPPDASGKRRHFVSDVVVTAGDRDVSPLEDVVARAAQAASA